MPNPSIECLVPGRFRLPATPGASIVVCAGVQAALNATTAGRKGAASVRHHFTSVAVAGASVEAASAALPPDFGLVLGAGASPSFSRD
jgi:hypothetical protein